MAEDKKPAPAVKKKKKVTKKQSAKPKAKPVRVTAPPQMTAAEAHQQAIDFAPSRPDGPVGNYTMGVHASEVGAMQREMRRRSLVGAGGPMDIGFGKSINGIPFANRAEAEHSFQTPGDLGDRLSDFVSGPGTSKRRRAAERFKAETEAARIPNRAAVLRGDLPAHRTLDNPRPDLGGGRSSGGGNTFERPSRPNIYPFGDSNVGVDRRFALNDTSGADFSIPGGGGGEAEEREPSAPFVPPPLAEPPRDIMFADNTSAEALAAMKLRRELRRQAIIQAFQDDDQEDPRRRRSA